MELLLLTSTYLTGKPHHARFFIKISNGISHRFYIPIAMTIAFKYSQTLIKINVYCESETIDMKISGLDSWNQNSKCFVSTSVCKFNKLCV